jgi:phage terminase large subunit
MSLVKLTNVFRRNAEALINAINGTGPRLIINEGGQGSSKTYSILQVIYNALSSGPKMKTTFCSYALPHLKQGVIADFDNILNSFGEETAEVKSSPAQPLYKIGKSEINCYGVEGNLAMAHGPRRKILYINECNRKITYDVFDQLFSRSEITFVDYNPDREFWMHEKVMPNIPHVLIRSNFTDNPYLPQGELQNILMKKDKPQFTNWWRVYGLGLLGRLEGVVFSNWSHGDFDTSLPFGYGLDFGFNPDPDAMIKVAIDKKAKKIYAKECFYQANQLVENLRANISQYATMNDLIVADSASPRMIAELKGKSGDKHRFNVRPVVKFDGSVNEGIRILQDFELIIDEDSPNLEKELNNYIWNDKKAGIPIDDFNHLIDPLRYYVMTQLSKSSGYQKWSA